MLTRRRTLALTGSVAAAALTPPFARAQTTAKLPPVQTVPSVTFAVDGVVPGTQALPTYAAREAVEALLAAPQQKLEAWSTGAARLIRHETYLLGIHPFLLAVSTAYHRHHPIVFSPDMIWLVLLQGLANHVYVNAEKLRRHFVAHDGKLLLNLRRDGFVLGNPENDWEGVFGEFSVRIRDHIGQKTHDLLAAKYSTTGVVEAAAMEVALMDALQSYFVFSVTTLCGFPSVTLEGTPDDWLALRERTAELTKFDLDWWIPHVLPILDQFVASSRGNADKAFWCNFYKLMNPGSGKPHIHGHIVNLFPYIGKRTPDPKRLVADYETHVRSTYPGRTEAQIIDIITRFKAELEKGVATKTTILEPLRRNPWLGRGMTLGLREGMTTRSVGTKMNSAPVIWDYRGRPLQMEFLAGFTGATQDPTTLAIRPAIGWAVRHGVGA
jgi:hypothetical protein